ncbi:MAG TPA: HAMP domain-containing histidine kinase, partial [Candidatus Syntrophoarchaeum butanivorans]|nr:HAMP domain-containing histidine kinase [Candidatus Syntrophoarchaeum butanivorans]
MSGWGLDCRSQNGLLSFIEAISGSRTTRKEGAYSMSGYREGIVEMFERDQKIISEAITTKQLVIVGLFCIIIALELLFKIPLLYPVSVICALWLLSTLIYPLMRRVNATVRISYINFGYFVLELALLTMIIHFLGSVVWIGAIFYLIAVIYANVVFSWRAGVIVAIASAIFYLILFLLESHGIIPHYELFTLDPAFAGDKIGVVTLISIGTGVFLLGVYAVKTFERVIREEGQMAEERRAIISLLNHDLKNYLTLISGYHGLYNQQDDPRLARAHAKIEENIKKIDETLTAAGLYSKIRDPSFEMKVEMVDLTRLMRDTIEKTLEDFPSNDQSVSFEADDTFRLRGDSFLLAACFENLIRNAMTYGGGRLDISIKDEGETYRIEFRDYGDGIPDGMKERIFERLESGKKVEGMKGTGVGLALVKKIVKMHDGDVWVEDNP